MTPIKSDDQENKTEIQDEAYTQFLKELEESTHTGITSVHQGINKLAEKETMQPDERTMQTIQDAGDTMDVNRRKLIDMLTNERQELPIEMTLTLYNAITMMMELGDAQMDIRVRQISTGEQEAVFEQSVRRKQDKYTILQPRHQKKTQESDVSIIKTSKEEIVTQQPEPIRITTPSQYRIGDAGRPTQSTEVDHVLLPRLRPTQLPIMDVFRMCIVGKWGLSCKLARMVHALTRQAQGRLGWLNEQLQRTLKDVSRDQENDAGNILRRACPFQDTPWRNFPRFPSSYVSSPYDLSLTTWIVLIALHGASQVNKGPSMIALHTASISEVNWQISICLISEDRIAAFAEIPRHQEIYQQKYREGKARILALLHTQLDVQTEVSTGKAPHLWLTKAMRLSDSLVQMMMRNLELDVVRYGQGKLTQEQVMNCDRDPAVFDVAHYACGRIYTPLEPTTMDHPQTSYTCPWTWTYPYDVPSYYTTFQRDRAILPSQHF